MQLAFGGSMETHNLRIKEIPATIWGSHSDKVYLYVHGQGGNKNEAKDFAIIASEYGYQVLSIDLPEHGERKKGNISFEPWNVVPELSCVIAYCKQQWRETSLFANSIGAWLSMLAFSNEKIKRCLFVSPVVDMVDLISNMMVWANVSELQLEHEKLISTDFGQTLSWRYWLYAQEHPIKSWNVPTKILYGEKDNLIGRSTVETFCKKFQSELTITKDGEHWFYTTPQLDVLMGWARKSFQIESIHQNKVLTRDR